MALVEWRDEFRIGIESVDHEHRALIQLINDLHARVADGGDGGEADREAVLDFLGEVNTKISSHFALEEKIMRERGYDEFAEHKADHERLLDGVRDIMDDYESGTYANYGEVLSATCGIGSRSISRPGTPACT